MYFKYYNNYDRYTKNYHVLPISGRIWAYGRSDMYRGTLTLVTLFPKIFARSSF